MENDVVNDAVNEPAKVNDKSYKCSKCGTFSVEVDYSWGRNGLGEDRHWRDYTCLNCGEMISVEDYYGESFEDGATIYF